MKYLYLITTFFILFSSQIYAQNIKWMTMNQALEAQKKNPKKIFVDIYATWCGPCKALDNNTFKNKDVVKYINENFYPVKFNAEGNEKVTYKSKTYTNDSKQTHPFVFIFGVKGYPTLLFFNEKGDLIYPHSGYITPSQIEPILKLFAEDKYLKIKTQDDYENYLKNFKNTFS